MPYRALGSLDSASYDATYPAVGSEVLVAPWSFESAFVPLPRANDAHREDND